MEYDLSRKLSKRDPPPKPFCWFKTPRTCGYAKFEQLLSASHHPLLNSHDHPSTTNYEDKVMHPVYY